MSSSAAFPSLGASSNSAPEQLFNRPNKIVLLYRNLDARFHKTIDDLTPWVLPRWIGTVVLSVLYVLRVYSLGGWHIISYALGIYILNLLIGFLSPAVDPEFEGGSLPSKGDDEFRPFVRRLPEFKFWYATTRAFVVAFVCTFVSFLNIPVFWPILLIYFVVLFVVTMKKQIQHMLQYKYIPFTTGKKRYRGKMAGSEKPK